MEAGGPGGARASARGSRERRRGLGRPEGRARPGHGRSARGCPAIGGSRKEDHRGIGEAQRGPHLVLLARDATG